jgi:hypothetical protein
MKEVSLAACQMRSFVVTESYLEKDNIGLLGNMGGLAEIGVSAYKPRRFWLLLLICFQTLSEKCSHATSEYSCII